MMLIIHFFKYMYEKHIILLYKNNISFLKKIIIYMMKNMKLIFLI
jgi:hypothetical protein